MRIFIGVSCLCLALVSPDAAWAQKKDKKKGAKDGSPATLQEYTQIQNVKELTGKLAYTDGKSSITFRLEIPHMEPNPAFKPGKIGGGIDIDRRMREIMNDQAAIARAKNPLERQRRMLELQRDMERLQLDIARAMAKSAGKASKEGPFKVVTEKKDFDLELSDKINVRWNTPPFQYDDKGDVKVYTKEELAELRGKDPKLPGYTGKLDDLIPGQTVKVFLTPPPKEKEKEKKTKLLDDVEGVGNVARPSVNMILILEESSLPLPPPKKGKK